MVASNLHQKNLVKSKEYNVYLLIPVRWKIGFFFFELILLLHETRALKFVENLFFFFHIIELLSIFLNM